MPKDLKKEDLERLIERLRGPFAQISFHVDVISRISQVHLHGADDIDVYLENSMVDIAERQESGQIQLADREEQFATKYPARFDFSPETFSLSKVWFTDTDIGSLLTGLSFSGPADREIEITTAAEVCCLYVNVGAFSSVSEPEYEDSAYRKVTV